MPDIQVTPIATQTLAAQQMQFTVTALYSQEKQAADVISAYQRVRNTKPFRAIFEELPIKGKTTREIWDLIIAHNYRPPVKLAYLTQLLGRAGYRVSSRGPSTPTSPNTWSKR